MWCEWPADEIAAREAQLEGLKGDGERLRGANAKVLGLLKGKGDAEAKAEAAGRREWEKQAKEAEKKAAEGVAKEAALRPQIAALRSAAADGFELHFLCIPIHPCGSE